MGRFIIQESNISFMTPLLFTPIPHRPSGGHTLTMSWVWTNTSHCCLGRRLWRAAAFAIRRRSCISSTCRMSLRRVDVYGRDECCLGICHPCGIGHPHGGRSGQLGQPSKPGHEMLGQQVSSSPGHTSLLFYSFVRA